MQEVLIIENEYSYVKGAFDFVNEFMMNNSLHYRVISRSQDVPWDELSNYNFIFVDISLSQRSELDGYGILQRIEKEQLKTKNIVILTANMNIESMLKVRGINNKYKTLIKPIDLNDLYHTFENGGSFTERINKFN